MTSTSTSAVGTARAETRLREIRESGLEWLLSRISPAGVPVGADSVNSWYRLPWALAGAGRPLEAGRVLSWIERNALTVGGDLVPGPAQTPWTEVNAPYPLGNLAIGAWQLERYGTANRIMDNLERFQSPQTGGAFVEHPSVRHSGRQDVLCTAQIGMAALMCGRRAMADGAFRWFSGLLDQNVTPETLFISTDSDGRVLTDFAPEASFAHVVRLQEARQAFFTPGISAAFLARYHTATGESSARDLARRLLALTEGGTERQYEWSDTVHVGKYAWGAATMLEVDADPRYLNALLMMADWLSDCQEADGRWNPSAFLFPKPDEPGALWKTAEHVMIINFMLGALGAHDATVGADRG